MAFFWLLDGARNYEFGSGVVDIKRGYGILHPCPTVLVMGNGCDVTTCFANFWPFDAGDVILPILALFHGL